jgi:hypothetical protein
MAFSSGTIPKRSGLDDGMVKTKKMQKAEALAKRALLQPSNEDDDNVPANHKPKPTQAKASALKIQPGESMSEFRIRVDAALPLTGITRTTKKVAGVPDHRVTKHERRLKRLQKGWREEEVRIRDKEAEAAELAEEDEWEKDALWEDKTADDAPGAGRKRKSSKKKRKLVVGEVNTNSDDEWAALQKSRASTAQKSVHDVVSAPPTFTKVPREIFKVKNGAGAKVGNIPAAAGSLAKREELGVQRQGIIESYREIMAKRKGSAVASATV